MWLVCAVSKKFDRTETLLLLWQGLPSYTESRLFKVFFVFLIQRLSLAFAGLLFLVAPAANAGNPIFVLNSLDANVSVIDPVTWQETRRIPTGKEPHHLYLTPDEKSVIVANAGSDSLTFIDPRTAEVQRVVRGTLERDRAGLARDAVDNLEKLGPTYVKLGQILSIR